MATKEKKTIKKKEKKADKEEVMAVAVESVAPPSSTAVAPVDIQPPPEIAAPSAVDENKDSRDDKRDESKAHEPKRAQRGMSNVFALFNQSQIQEFKEAFTMIDQNRDGLIDIEDLRAIYTHIGRQPDAKVLEEMLAEAPGAINFTMFLGLFGDRLKGTDPESTLREAFIMFDTDGKGKLQEEYVKDLLMNVGDQFSKEEIKQVWKEAPLEGGWLDYLKFVQIIKRGKDDE